MNGLLARLFQSDGLRQSLFTLVGNTAATGLSAITLIIISRVLGPVSFGEFSVGFALILMLNRFNDLGLNAAILRFVPTRKEKEQGEVNRIFSYVIRLKLIVSGFIFILGLFISPWLIEVLHFHQPYIIYLAFFFNLISVLYEQMLTVLQSLHRFPQAVAINGIQSGSKLMVTLLLFLLSLGNSFTLYVWYMFAPLIPVLIAQRLLPKWVKLNFFQNFQKERELVSGMARHAAVGFIAAGIIENIDILFVQNSLSAYETGLLGGTGKIAMMLSLVAYSLGNVLYPRVARYKEKRHLSKYLKKAGIVAALSAIGFLSFVPFAKLAIQWTIGPEYLAGVNILYILTAASFFSIAIVPFQAVFYTLKADWYFSVSGAVQLAIVILGNWIFVPEFGLEASAWTRLTARIFLFLFTVSLSIWVYYHHYVKQKAD